MSRAPGRQAPSSVDARGGDDDDDGAWDDADANAGNRRARRDEAMRVLDVRGDDDASAVRLAYRRLALRHHPDKHRGDPDAERKFREVVRAYETLTRDYGLSGRDLGAELGDRFESAEDMRDFAASFFESFFFGGGFGRNGGPNAPPGAFGQHLDDDDVSSGEYDDDESESDSLPSLDDYDDEDEDDMDDYSDDDDEYTDLQNFFGHEPLPSSWGGNRGSRGMPGKWFGRPGDSQSSGSGGGRPSMTDDQLFEHLEQMRKEAARYAAELAKQENEARRAAEPLEKLQRPTLVTRTDSSITLNLYRTKSTTQTLPQDRCWELSLKKDKEQNYSVFTSVKGKTIITVSDLLPGTKYCFKARVGRVDESSGEVTEWGPHSVESAYVTSGRAPTGNTGKQVVSSAKDDTAVVEAGMGKKAKKRAAKEQAEREERERAAAAEKQGNAASAVDEAAARQAALRQAAEEAAEREMAEMEAIRKRLEASKKPDAVKAEPSAGEGLSKKAAQRKKKKERAKAEELAKQPGPQQTTSSLNIGGGFPETDEELARRLQAEEDRASMLVEEKYKQSLSARPPPSGSPPSWAAAPAMRVPGIRADAGTSSMPPGFASGPTPMAASQQSRRLKEEGQSSGGPPPLPPGPRPPAGYGAMQEPLAHSQQPAWATQGSAIGSAKPWGDAPKGAPPVLAPTPQPTAQPARWSPANSNWEPMGATTGMSSLPLGDVFAADTSSQSLQSGGLFSGMGSEWGTSPVASSQWGTQSTWDGGAQQQQGSMVSADWGLGGLGVSSDLNPGANWGAFGGTSPSTAPGMWSNPADGLSAGINGMSIGSPDAHQGGQQQQRSPGGEDPNLLDSSLLSFLG